MVTVSHRTNAAHEYFKVFCLFLFATIVFADNSGAGHTPRRALLELDPIQDTTKPWWHPANFRDKAGSHIEYRVRAETEVRRIAREENTRTPSQRMQAVTGKPPIEYKQPDVITNLPAEVPAARASAVQAGSAPAERTASASAVVTRGLPTCHLHVFRHVSKAAGTTMRFIFDKQVMMGEWEFLPDCHYGFSQKEWKDAAGRFMEAAEQWSGGGRQGSGPRILVEIRNSWGAASFVSHIVPELARMREAVAPLGCEVTSSFLMREPVAQYISFYRYYIDKEQRKGAAGQAAWGQDITEWVEWKGVHDIQVRELLGNKCTGQLREAPYTPNGPKPVPENCQVDDTDLSKFKQVAKGFDVVGTTSRFDEFWIRLSDLVGFQHLEYSASNKAHGSGAGDKWKIPNLDPEVKDALLAATEYDRKGYSIIQQEEEAQLVEAGDELQERLQQFRDASVKEGSTSFTGGKPPKSLYKWVKFSDQPDEDDIVKPDFYTGAPKCRGFGSPHVVLVRKDTEYKCDRGCTFDG